MKFGRESSNEEYQSKEISGFNCTSSQTTKCMCNSNFLSSYMIHLSLNSLQN